MYTSVSICMYVFFAQDFNYMYVWQMESTMPPKNPPPGGEGGAGGPPDKVEAEEDDGRDIFARAADVDDDVDGDRAGQQWAMHGAEAGESRPDPRFKYDDPQSQPGGPMDPSSSSRHSYIDLTCLSPPPLNPAPPGSFPTFSREPQGPPTAEGDAVEDEGHHRRKMDRNGRGWPPYFPSSEDSGKTDAAWGRGTCQGDTGEDCDLGQTLSGSPNRSGLPFSPLRSFSYTNLNQPSTSHPNLPTTSQEPEVQLPRNTSYESLHEID